MEWRVFESSRAKLSRVRFGVAAFARWEREFSFCFVWGEHSPATAANNSYTANSIHPPQHGSHAFVVCDAASCGAVDTKLFASRIPRAVDGARFCCRRRRCCGSFAREMLETLVFSEKQLCAFIRIFTVFCFIRVCGVSLRICLLAVCFTDNAAYASASLLRRGDVCFNAFAICVWRE